MMTVDDPIHSGVAKLKAGTRSSIYGCNLRNVGQDTHIPPRQ